MRDDHHDVTMVEVGQEMFVEKVSLDKYPVPHTLMWLNLVNLDY